MSIIIKPKTPPAASPASTTVVKPIKPVNYSRSTLVEVPPEASQKREIKGNLKSPFIFSLCQPGAEKVHKEEIKNIHPEYHSAYQRPGFVTFKGTEMMGPDVRFESTLSRTFGISLKTVKFDPAANASTELNDEIQQKAQELIEELTTILKSNEATSPAEKSAPAIVHVWDCALTEVRDSSSHVANLHSPLYDALVHFNDRSLFSFQTHATDGALVFDLIVQSENEVWIGAHLQSRFHYQTPPEYLTLPLPEKAPSRAYFKLLESLDLARIRMPFGTTAIEIGSSPGGASLALLEKGVNVIGIDPAEMDRVVLRFPEFSHVRRGVLNIEGHDLDVFDAPPEWILLDMNVAPNTALNSIDHILSVIRRPERTQGLILTLKLNDWSYVSEIRFYLNRIYDYGFTDIVAKQLTTNRQEFCVVARR